VLQRLPWVAGSRSRVRDQGHVFHVESFVVGREGEVTLAQLEEATGVLQGLDWKINDVVVIPVRELPGWVASTAR